MQNATWLEEVAETQQLAHHPDNKRRDDDSSGINGSLANAAFEVPLCVALRLDLLIAWGLGAEAACPGGPDGSATQDGHDKQRQQTQTRSSHDIVVQESRGKRLHGWDRDDAEAKLQNRGSEADGRQLIFLITPADNELDHIDVRSGDAKTGDQCRQLGEKYREQQESDAENANGPDSAPDTEA